MHTIANSTEPDKISPADSALTRVNHNLDQQREIIAMLADRLVPLLASGGKADNSAKPQAVGASPLVDIVLRQGDTVDANNAALRDLLDRLTV